MTTFYANEPSELDKPLKTASAAVSYDKNNKTVYIVLRFVELTKRKPDQYAPNGYFTELYDFTTAKNESYPVCELKRSSQKKIDKIESLLETSYPAILENYEKGESSDLLILETIVSKI